MPVSVLIQDTSKTGCRELKKNRIFIQFSNRLEAPPLPERKFGVRHCSHNDVKSYGPIFLPYWKDTSTVFVISLTSQKYSGSFNGSLFCEEQWRKQRGDSYNQYELFEEQLEDCWWVGDVAKYEPTR